MSDQEQAGQIVAIDSGLAASLAGAEIEQQIATAHRYPRSVQRAMGNILSMATLDDDTAEECIYSLPRDGKVIEGPSARFAELVMQNWGNCRVAARVVREEKDYIVAQAIYHDLETNAAISTEVQRRISGRNGRRYSNDMIVTTGNAACSIARRNIILAGVPRAVWRKSYDKAREVVMGGFETLANRRTKALEAFQRYGVSADQVFEALKVAGVEEITLDHLVTLRGMLSALKNNEATPEEMFSSGQRAPMATSSGNPLREPNGDAQESTAADSKAATTSSSDPAEHGKTDAKGDGPAPGGNSQGQGQTFDYGAFHRALLRAKQKKTVEALNDQFRTANAWTMESAAKATLDKIYGLHLQRADEKIAAGAFMAEIEKLGAA